MDRKEIVLTGVVKTTPLVTPMDISVDGLPNLSIGSPRPGQKSVIITRNVVITGNSGAVTVSVGATDWVADEQFMPGNITEVAIGSDDFVPLIVASEVVLGNFIEGAYILSFRVTPPVDIDLNEYTQQIVVIGELAV